MEHDHAAMGRPDVWALRPEAQRVALQAANVYLEYTRPWMIGLLAHGSALKGDFIPGCSDVDLQLYLRDDAFDADGRMPFDLSFWIQRSLSVIDLGPFAYIQCYALPVTPREGWIGPIPGAYHMIFGRLPRPEATADGLRESAINALSTMRPVPNDIANSLLTFSPARLERHARFLCTDIWPSIHHVLTLDGSDPFAAWRLPKTEAIEQLPTSELRDGAARFFQTTRRAFDPESSRLYDTARWINGLTDVIWEGVEFRKAVARWYQAWTAR